MHDLDQRFRSLARTRVPDLWEEATAREPGPPPSPRSGPRVVAALTAFAVAIAGFAVVVVSFRGEAPAARETPSQLPPVIENGLIAVAQGPDADIALLDPETGASTVLVERHQEGQTGGLQMAWSPDGSRLAFTDYRGNDLIGLFILDLTSGEVIDVSSGLSNAEEPAWSPDGTQVAFTGCGCEGGYEIYVVGADGEGLRPVTDEPDDGASGAHFPAWSPDGTRIAFAFALYDAATETQSSGTAILDLETDAETTVTETLDVDENPAWSPDGTKIAFLRKVTGVEEVLVANADGSGERSIVRDDADPIPMSPPSWSPDGSQVLFGAAIDDWGVWLADADGTNPRPILEDAFAAGPVWAPDGTQIAFVGDDAGRPLPRVAIRLIRPDGSEDRALATMESVSELAWQPLTASPTPSPVASSNGPIYFQHLGADGDDPGRIESVEPDGSGRRVVFEGEPMRIAQLAWSPDGARIAYRNPIPNERGIYVANADGSDPVRLTDGSNDGWPSWSPDGTRIAFSSTRYDPSIEPCEGRSGQDFLCPTDLYSMDADGSNVERLTTDWTAEFQPAWSPMGDRIAFVRAIGGGGGASEAPLIFAMGADGSDPRQISQLVGAWSGSDYAPSWSPDGTRIAFVGFRLEDFGLWLVNADGSGDRSIEASLAPIWANRPAWSPDGTQIAFACMLPGADESMALCLMAPDGSGLEPLVEVPWDTGDIAWRPIPADDTPVPTPTSEPTPPPAAPTATVEETIEVGQASALLSAAGSVWVAGFEAGPEYLPYVIRIDGRSGDELARIPVETIPDSGASGGGGMVFDGRYVWLVGTVSSRGEPDRGVLVRIDPQTNAAETFDLDVGATGSSLVFDGGEPLDERSDLRGSGPESASVRSGDQFRRGRDPLRG